MARNDIIDTSELLEFADHLAIAPKRAKKAKKKLLREQGTKLRRKTAQKARVEVRKTAVDRSPKYTRKAGEYHGKIKRGKPYEERGQERIRVYSGDQVAHLIEDGYDPVSRDGSRGTHQAGKKVFEDTRIDFEDQFNDAVEEMVDDLVHDI